MAVVMRGVMRAVLVHASKADFPARRRLHGLTPVTAPSIRRVQHVSRRLLSHHLYRTKQKDVTNV